MQIGHHSTKLQELASSARAQCLKAYADCCILKYVTANADAASFVPNHTHTVVTIVKGKEKAKTRREWGVRRGLRFPTTFPSLLAKTAGDLN